MAQNLISATQSAEDAAAVQQNPTDAKARLSFLVNLHPSYISSLLKMGNGYFLFIKKKYQIVIAHPEILPECLIGKSLSDIITWCRKSGPSLT